MSSLTPPYHVLAQLAISDQVEIFRVWRSGSHHLVDLKLKSGTQMFYWRCQLAELVHLFEQGGKLPVLVWVSAKDIPVELLYLPWTYREDSVDLSSLEVS